MTSPDPTPPEPLPDWDDEDTGPWRIGEHYQLLPVPPSSGAWEWVWLVVGLIGLAVCMVGMVFAVT